MAVGSEGPAAVQCEQMQLIRLQLLHSADPGRLAASWGLHVSGGGAGPEQLAPMQARIRNDGTLGFLSVQTAACLWPGTGAL
ncbi:hypothetical protein [Poseidonocella sp. HB161398]|uniref:hypothetical protein n=1 Tax=Poseidonocella sp. HB161398 TaxID=2320855 RepID=UPI00110823F3|nr:hypothetical protein [Poseidonocella sp. HB161398]